MSVHVFSVLLIPRGAGVEQAEPCPAVPIGHSADGHPGLLENLVQCGFLNGCRRDALLVCEKLQLPVRGRDNGLVLDTQYYSRCGSHSTEKPKMYSSMKYAYLVCTYSK